MSSAEQAAPGQPEISATLPARIFYSNYTVTVCEGETINYRLTGRNYDHYKYSINMNLLRRFMAEKDYRPRNDKEAHNIFPGAQNAIYTSGCSRRKGN